MKNIYKRTFLYGTAGIALSALAYGAWFHKPGADNETLVSCAEMELRFGMATEAGQKAEVVLARDPGNLAALLIAAHCRTLLKDPDGAREYYERALSHCGDQTDLDAEVRVALAQDAVGQKNYARAAMFVSSVRTPTAASTRVKVFYTQGLLADGLGDSVAATDCYEKAAGEPDCGEDSLQFAAALRLADLGKKNAAIVALDRLSSGRFGIANYYCGKFKFQIGEADRAIENLRRLTSSDKKLLGDVTKADAGFWETIWQRGELPADVREWILPF
jgi:tetratricopeptide (TPR) repeat protein